MAPDKPDDTFMYARRRDPRPAFVESLKQELDTQSAATANPGRRTGSVMSGRIWPRLVAGLLLLAGLFAVSFSISPDVRAMTRSLLGIEGQVPLDIARDAIGFELPQYLPDNVELTTLCSNVVATQCGDDVSTQAWVNLSEEGSGWASVYYTRSDTDEDRSTAMVLSVIKFHPDKPLTTYIEDMEARWQSLGDIGGVYNAPRINRAIGYQTYRTRNGIAGSTTLEWFQDDLKYVVRLYNNSLEMPTTDLLQQARQVARSIPAAEATDTP